MPWARLLLVGTVLGGLSAPLGWVATDRLEQRNEFCVACHLEGGTPLHQAKGEELRSRPPISLAAAHATHEAGFRCIDCHGGASFVGKLRVKVVAARDAASYLLGRFEEPDEMRHPLWDEDCVQCHAAYRPERDDAFHAIGVHNVDLPYACIACHGGHPEGPPGLHFLRKETVLPVCRNCHEEF